MSQGFTRPLTTADITVRKNTGSDVGSRPRLNFIEGSNVTLTISDDAAGGEIDITIAAASGAPSTLNEIGNVTITSNSAGEILKWSGSAWINNTLAEAGIADTSHAADHADGGSDELTGNLAANARVAVSKNSGATVGTRRTLNFIEGSNVTLTIADDAGGEEVDITITSTAGGGSPLTTKGDLYTYSTSDARLGVGTNGYILTPDSGETTGLKWTNQFEATMQFAAGTQLHFEDDSASGDYWLIRGAGADEFQIRANFVADRAILSVISESHATLAGDVTLYTPADGTQILKYDHSQTRILLSKTVDGQGNQFLDVEEVSSWEENFTLGAKGSTATARNVTISAWDGSVQRTRIFIDGDGDLSFYKSGGSLAMSHSTSEDEWNIYDGVDMNNNPLIGPLDPTAGTHVGDRDYNDARYAQANTIYLTYSLEGTFVTGGGTMRIPMTVAGTIQNVRFACNTSPTGAAAIVDVNKNGTTIFTTQGNRPTIAISGTDSGNKVPDVTAVAAGDYLTVDIDQIGSTVAGADGVVVIEIEI